MNKFILLTIFITTILSAKTYTIYVNSHLNPELTYKKWNPTVELLNKKLPEYKFKLLPIKPNEIDKIKNLLDEEKIDFLITQPAIYSELEYTKGINRILTMTNKFGMNKYGSVLITHKDNAINNILDIEAKTVAAVAPLGFGGWLIGYNEMYDKGIDPIKNNKIYFTGSQKKVVEFILDKKYDVGVIRTGMLENLSNNYNIDIGNIKIINEIQTKYPLKISTKLFPEWSFAVARHIDNHKLKSDIFKAMNSITEDSEAAIVGQYQNWSIPQNYSDVDKLLKKFRLSHYKDMKEYSYGDMIKISMFILLFSILILFYLKYKMSLQVQKNLIQTKKDLANQVEEEIEKNRKKDQQILSQSRLAQMGEMISMIAHQWRQPLAAISSTSIDMQMKSKLKYFDLEQKQKVQEYEAYINEGLANIDNLVQSLTTTIDDFRNFYQPNKKSAMVKLGDVIDKAINIIKPSLINHNVNIIKEYNFDQEIEVYDKEMMQVILNLLHNAKESLKEKRKKDRKIIIKTENRAISVCNNGGQIPDDIIDKIFDPYFSTKDEKNGTGLGLYMSKIIVEEHHNGKLNVKNTEDGVCFTIELGIVSKK